MNYLPGDIVILWERRRPWPWYRQQFAKRKLLSILQEAVWANLVRLISGPIHVGMVATQGSRLEELWVYDSAESGVQRRRFWTWPDEIAVFRARNWSPEETTRILRVWQSWVKQDVRYGWVRNVAHFLDYVLELVVRVLALGLWRPRIALFRSLVPGGHLWGRECSNAVVAAIYEATRYDFGWKWADPGDIYRFCLDGLYYQRILARTGDWWGL